MYGKVLASLALVAFLIMGASHVAQGQGTTPPDYSHLNDWQRTQRAYCTMVDPHVAEDLDLKRNCLMKARMFFDGKKVINFYCKRYVAKFRIL
jgi:hypothetical protein